MDNILNEYKCIFNKVDGSNDVGIDAYIEFVENKGVTGLCIGVQIKAGNSNLSTNGENIYLKSDKKHFEYWQSHILPIIGVVYIPEEKKAFWVDITQYLKDNEIVIEEGPYNIKLTRDNELSVDSFKEFHNYLKKYIEEYSRDWNFGKSLSLFVENEGLEQRLAALKSLFYYHRSRRTTWAFLLRQFGIEENINIQKQLIDIFVHLEGHPDIYWHKDNIMPHDIREYGKFLINSFFGIKELRILLRNIDDDGIVRGTISQHIYSLISIIPNKNQLLEEIILDIGTRDSNRSIAALLIINDLQYRDTNEAINFAERIIVNFTKQQYIEKIQILIDLLEQDGGFDIF